jgi:hypothetical protein
MELDLDQDSQHEPGRTSSIALAVAGFMIGNVIPIWGRLTSDYPKAVAVLHGIAASEVVDTVVGRPPKDAIIAGAIVAATATACCELSSSMDATRDLSFRERIVYRFGQFKRYSSVGAAGFVGGACQEVENIRPGWGWAAAASSIAVGGLFNLLSKRKKKE